MSGILMSTTALGETFLRKSCMAFPSRERLGLALESWGPVMLGLTVFLVSASSQDAIREWFVSGALSLPQFHTGLFGWASVMTGFQFGVYSVIVGKSEGFIEAARLTSAMELFLSYVSRAVVLGFVLTLLGIPLLVANKEMKDVGTVFFISSSAYFGIFVWSFAATARVAYIFSIIAKIRSVKRMPG